MSAAAADEYQTAYVILGRGKETREKCRVPPGCAVIVDAHIAELIDLNSLTRKFDKFFEYYRDRDIKNKEKFINPVKNYLELTKTISTSGSLAIYTEGQLCPNFLYTLVLYDISEGDRFRGKEIKMYDSGISQYPFYHRSTGPFYSSKYYDSFTRTDTHPIIKLADHYDKSIYPTKKDVKDFIKANPPLEKKGIATYASTVMTMNEPFVITQKGLFDLVTSGKIKPGVFYNLVSRSIGRQVNNLSRRLLPAHNKLLRPELRALIREAEWHRKPFVRGAVSEKLERKVAELEDTKQAIPQLEEQLANEKATLAELERSDKSNKKYNIRTKEYTISYLENQLKYLKGEEGIPFLEKQLAAWSQTRRNRPGRWKKTASGRRWTLKKDNEV